MNYKSRQRDRIIRQMLGFQKALKIKTNYKNAKKALDRIDNYLAC